MKRRFILCVLLVVIVCTAHAQVAKSNLASYFSGLSQNLQFTGNVLVAEHGKVVYEKSFGYADPEAKKWNALTTQFPVCSITKTFVATSILQLMEKGRLELDDAAMKYLPGFIYPDITIRQLLSHTSGLPPYYGTFDSLIGRHPDLILTNQGLVDCYRLANKPLAFKPGDRFDYNNANFVVLAIIITKITGLNIGTYISRNILHPAGMKHTFLKDYFQLSAGFKKTSRMAIPYYWPHLYSDKLVRVDSIPFLVDAAKHDHLSGYGDMVSTLHDLLRYDQALYEGKLLKAATLNEAFTPVRLNNGQINPGVWGLGWQIDQVGKMVNHGGGMAGMYLSFTRNLEKRQTAIIFSISREALSRPVANDALKILNGQKIYPKKSAAYIFGKLLVNEGSGPAMKFLEKAKNDTALYQLSEYEFNTLGYAFIGDQFIYHLPAVHFYPQALEVFKLNTELFPGSWNVYDSYGEALEKTGQKEEAIRMYKKSLQLNPNNTGGAEQLKKLQ